jgi:hypothetical protein
MEAKEKSLDEIHKLQAKLEKQNEIKEYSIQLIKDNLSDSEKLQIIEDEIKRLDNLIPIIKKLEHYINMTKRVNIEDRKLSYKVNLLDRKLARIDEVIWKNIKINKKDICLVSMMNNFKQDIEKYDRENSKYERIKRGHGNHMDEPIDMDYLEQYDIYTQINGIINYILQEYKLLNTSNINNIILQVIVFNQEKQNKLDEIIKKETSIEVIEKKIEFLLNEKLNLITSTIKS